MNRPWLAALASLLVSPAFAADKPLSAADQVAQMNRGVNIVGYDPLWQDAAKARFKPRLFKTIKDGGFDHVRMNLHAFRHMDAAGKLDPIWLATLDSLVDAALARGLHVILDEHDYETCATDTAECRRRVLAFWSQIAPHYRKSPNRVLFEILNEPNGKMDAEWNSLLADALALIRTTNPKRNVVVGPAFWNNISYLTKLELPPKDRHLIVTVHYYAPMRFTHQGARWTAEYRDVSGVPWGSTGELATLDTDFDTVQSWSRAHDRPILLGEFGAYDAAPLESRVAYTSAVARAAEARGWSWSYWQFDSNFVVYLVDEDRWNEPIYRALVPAR